MVSIIFLITWYSGTWLNSDNGYDEKTRTLIDPSNVTRFARALKPDTEVGGVTIPQITYYQAGVGATSSFFEHINGGATGFGLDEHIREAYAFIAQNWRPGDEIFLIGFSRGAFTARSIAGLISTVGILTKSGMNHFYQIFIDYEKMNQGEYDNPRKELVFPPGCIPLGKKTEPGQRSNQENYVNFLRTYKVVLKPCAIIL
jgi:hypothetical protein